MAFAGKTIFYLSKPGLALAKRLGEMFPEASMERFDPKTISRLWRERQALIFIMAAGIVVRALAPLLKDKKTDPAVVVLDEKGRFALSLLSGHLGGANRLAREIAAYLGGEAVITTSSDVHGATALDLWARENGLLPEPLSLLARKSRRLIEEGCLEVFTETGIDLPADLIAAGSPGKADLLITNKKDLFRAPGGGALESGAAGRPLYLRPKNLVVGVGCNRNTPEEEIKEAVLNTLIKHNLSPLSLSALATVASKGSEEGLVSFAEKHRLPLRLFSPAELNRVPGIKESEAARKALGARAVAEPAALLAAGAAGLLVEKQRIGAVTVAVAQRDAPPRETEEKKAGLQDNPVSRLYVVGTGPGGQNQLTPQARAALAGSSVVIGYRPYLEAIGGFLLGKEVIGSAMTEEVKRCSLALDLARAGKTVALVSGGDPGIYGMAGLVLELWKRRREENPEAASPEAGLAPEGFSVEIVPGISALNAAAARLGAPLAHDFAVISLSDRLTPWPVIEKRLDQAAAGDFVTVLYNPKSKGRPGYVEKTKEIFLRYRPEETPVGLVKGAGRDGERIAITTLAGLISQPVDMETTVIIGNSKTYVWNDLLITPRGYRV